MHADEGAADISDNSPGCWHSSATDHDTPSDRPGHEAGQLPDGHAHDCPSLAVSTAGSAAGRHAHVLSASHHA